MRRFTRKKMERRGIVLCIHINMTRFSNTKTCFGGAFFINKHTYVELYFFLGDAMNASVKLNTVRGKKWMVVVHKKVWNIALGLMCKFRCNLFTILLCDVLQFFSSLVSDGWKRMEGMYIRPIDKCIKCKWSWQMQMDK